MALSRDAPGTVTSLLAPLITGWLRGLANPAARRGEVYGADYEPGSSVRPGRPASRQNRSSG